MTVGSKIRAKKNLFDDITKGRLYEIQKIDTGTRRLFVLCDCGKIKFINFNEFDEYFSNVREERKTKLNEIQKHSDKM